MSTSKPNKDLIGKGLRSLLQNIDQDLKNTSGNLKNEIVEQVTTSSRIPLADIQVNPKNPRRDFDEQALQELSTSIKLHDIIQPLTVSKLPNGKYQLIAGERRFRAAKLLGFESILAIVKKINNHEALEMAIVENIQRSDLSLVEEANSYKQLIEEFSYTQDQIAQRVGKSRSHITNLLRILTLPQNVHDLLDRNLISMGHARAIINSSDPEKLANEIIDRSLTVRDIEDLVRDEKIEKIRNTPVLIRTESKIKFVNSEHLVQMENRLSQALGLEAKISYNSFKNNGKITIKFEEFEVISHLINILEGNEQS